MVTVVMIMFTSSVIQNVRKYLKPPRQYSYVSYIPLIGKVTVNNTYMQIPSHKTGTFVLKAYTEKKNHAVPASGQPVSVFVRSPQLTHNQWLAASSAAGKRLVRSYSRTTDMNGQARIQLHSQDVGTHIEVKFSIHNLSNSIIAGQHFSGGLVADWVSSSSPLYTADVNPYVSAAHKNATISLAIALRKNGRGQAGMAVSQMQGKSTRTNSQGIGILRTTVSGRRALPIRITTNTTPVSLGAEIVSNQPDIFLVPYRLAPHPRYHLNHQQSQGG